MYKVKSIGKPYAGKLLVQFDEGGLRNQSPTLQDVGRLGRIPSSF
jgi:hypothetical protein